MADVDNEGDVDKPPGDTCNQSKVEAADDPQSVAGWLESAGVEKCDYAENFREQFSCLKDLVTALEDEGTEAILEACDVKKFGDKVKLRRALGKLLGVAGPTPSGGVVKGVALLEGSGGKKKYEVIRKLGEGGFGETFLVQINSRQLALKRASAASYDEANLILAEASRMKDVQHHLIVRAIDIFLEPSPCSLAVCILMEFCDGGDLAQHIRMHSPINEQEAVRCLAPVAVALEHLHEKQVAHCDVKPANIFLCHTGGTLKLGDLGLAADMSATKTGEGMSGGTSGYMPPEAFDGPCLGADIWALGVTATELASGAAPPNRCLDTPELVKEILDRIPSAYSEDYKDAARQLLMKKGDRPSASCVVQLPAFRKACAQLGASNACGTSAPAESMKDLQKRVDEASWMAPLQVKDLSWHTVGDGHVRICTFAPDTGSEAEKEAHRLLMERICSAHGHETFCEDFQVLETVLCYSRPRATGLATQAMDLNQKYKEKDLFNLRSNDKWSSGGPDAVAEREHVLEFYQRYGNMACKSLGMDNVKFAFAFHAVPNYNIGLKVLQNNFAVLQKLDDGYIGQGIYVTLDAQYAIEEYGRNNYGLSRMFLVVCVIVMGNSFPVVEFPQYKGHTIVAGADSHICLMAHDEDAWRHVAEYGDPLPCAKKRWDQVKQVNTEVCLRGEAQLLPVALLTVESLKADAPPATVLSAYPCIRKCGKPSWSGAPGDYCSRACREKGPAADWEPCARLGCGKPAWNGEPNQFCGRACRALGVVGAYAAPAAAAPAALPPAVPGAGSSAPTTAPSSAANSASTSPPSRPICVRPGCGRFTWNGKLGEYCGRACRNQHKVVDPADAAAAAAPAVAAADAAAAATVVVAPAAAPGKAPSKSSLCARSGCGKPSFDGAPGNFCGRFCKSLGAPLEFLLGPDLMTHTGKLDCAQHLSLFKVVGLFFTAAW